MDEFDYYFKDEFFIIDSNNLNSIRTKLYGFVMDNGNIIENHNLLDLRELSFEGVYVYIYENGGDISIFQDFNGSMVYMFFSMKIILRFLIHFLNLWNI